MSKYWNAAALDSALLKVVRLRFASGAGVTPIAAEAMCELRVIGKLHDSQFPPSADDVEERLEFLRACGKVIVVEHRFVGGDGSATSTWWYRPL